MHTNYNYNIYGMEVDILSEQQKSVSGSSKMTKKDLKFSYFEPIAGIIIAIVAAVVFLGFPEIITVVFIGGQVIPTFDVEVIREIFNIILIVLWAVFRLGVDVSYLVERRYTKRLAQIAIVGNALALICACIVFIPYRIVYGGFIDWVYSYFASVSVGFGNILARPNLIILVLMIAVLVIESINVARKGYKAEEDKDEEDRNNESADNAS